MSRRFIRRLFSRFPGRSEEVPASIYLSQQPAYDAYQVGDWSYGQPRVLSWGEGAKLEIGRFCSIADGVTILLGGEHRIDWVTTYPFPTLFEAARSIPGHPRSKGDVVIGSDVWIGTEALVLSGTRVGHGAVIAARSVVTSDVAPFTIVGGNPAREIRNRFPAATVEALLRIAWWDWPMEKIVDSLPLLLSPNIDHFVETFDDPSQLSD